MDALIAGHEESAWRVLLTYLKSNSSRVSAKQVRIRAVSVIGELVLNNEEFRPIAMRGLREITRLCCPVAGASLPNKSCSELKDTCVKYLQQWKSLHGSEYPQLHFCLLSIPQTATLTPVQNLENAAATATKSKILFDAQQEQFTENEDDIHFVISETKECLRLYEECSRPLEGLKRLSMEHFTLDALKTVFGLESVERNMQRSEAKSLLLGKLKENERLFDRYGRLLNNTVQHCEIAVQTFPHSEEPYNGRAKHIRSRVVRLLTDIQRLEGECARVTGTT